MSMGKKYMTVVIIESKDIKSIPAEVRNGIFHKSTGNFIPKGYVADMSGEEILRRYSYDEIKKRGWYKEFVEISKAEKDKPEIGSLAHLVTKKAKVKNLNKEVKSLKFGSPVKTVLSQFEYKVKKGGDIGKEAQAIIDTVNKWGDEEHKAIEKLKSSEPTKAYMKMMVLAKTFYGLPLVENYNTELSTMKKDRYFAYLLGLRSQFERFMKDERKNPNSARYLSKKLEDFAGKVEDESLKKDAMAMVEELSEI